MANRGFKYRAYPTDEQKIFFAKSFGCCRKMYNLLLNDKIESYKSTGKFSNPTPAKFKKMEEYSYLNEVDSLALTNVQLQLNKAFANHFSKSRKSNTAFPKYKSKHKSRKSYTTNNQKDTIAVLDDYVKLPKIGKVKINIHRLPPADWKIKSATVSQDSAGNYFISILYEYEHTCSYTPDFSNCIGLDYKSDGLYMDSNGNIGSNHKYYRESQEKLAKEQRRLSRKIGSKKGEAKSNNYLKQLSKVNKIHVKIKNQRLDNLHKLSTEIANQCDAVFIEDINMQDISKFHGNGKATYDNGFGEFTTFLNYKMQDRGKIFMKVDKYFASSQICHVCGVKNPDVKDTKIRAWTCPHCGAKHDRDLNAAINIKLEGLRMLAET